MTRLAGPLSFGDGNNLYKAALEVVGINFEAGSLISILVLDSNG